MIYTKTTADVETGEMDICVLLALTIEPGHRHPSQCVTLIGLDVA